MKKNRQRFPKDFAAAMLGHFYFIADERDNPKYY